MRIVAQQFVKFGIVGLIATAINLLCLYFFTDIIGIYYMLSAVFAFFFADFAKYILNKVWTFRDGFRNKFFKRYCSFFIVSFIALGINLGLLYYITEFLGIYYIYSQLIAAFVSLWINFLGNKFWTFSIK